MNSNKEQIPLLKLLGGFEASENTKKLAESCTVLSATINRQRRSMDITLLAASQPSELLCELSREIRKHYSLSEVNFTLEGAPAEEKKSDGATASAPQRENAFDVTERLRREEYRKILKQEQSTKVFKSACLYGKPFKNKPVPICELNADTSWVAVQGQVFAAEHREFKNRGAVVINIEITDYTGSVKVTKYMEAAEAAPIMENVKPGSCIMVRGRMTMNRFDNELVLDPSAIMTAEKEKRVEESEYARVELHLHTQMSEMDALTDTAAVVAQAAAWGQKAIAITDHGVVQSFPDAIKAGKKHGIKILYGVEGYLVEAPFVRGAEGPIDQEIVYFDVETTGLNSAKDVIIEYGAVICKNGEEIARFNSFADPGGPLPQQITELTGITDQMLIGAPSQREALLAFLDFVGSRPLAAHNAQFDIGFIRRTCDREGIAYDPGYIDSLTLSQSMLPGLAHYTLDGVANELKLGDFNHHRAADDAFILAKILEALFDKLIKEKGSKTLEEINDLVKPSKATLRQISRSSRHIILLATNKQGLYDLYHLVSISHLEYFHRQPHIPRHWLERLRGDLIVGSACESGELFKTMVDGAGDIELKRIAAKYDYLEIQPICNNAFLIGEGLAKNDEDLREFNRRIVRLGEEMGKPVVATGDVHFLDPHDEIYRRILMAGKGFKDADRELPLYFRSTADMLNEFSYLGEEKALEVVVTNTNAIAERCESMKPTPDGLYPPRIENSKQEREDMVWGKAKRLYGDPLPDIVRTRLEAELKDIIDCSYDVIYVSASRLVRKSNEAGYLVGSRGSVGSSLVAFMSDITEVNALGPHYRCPQCQHSEFVDDPEYGCGADLPDKLCPNCGHEYDKDGFSIPFETFLGFGGDKVPDIDLNFSGFYQSQAHKNVSELFGEDKCFKAGTIGTLKDKTAYGFVKKYLEERDMKVSSSEENRLVMGCCGVKRTTGQHPGGIVVIPADKEIYFFCPVQHPANDVDSDIITTHFDYHSMEDNLLKLDMLGHDDPSVLRLMADTTGIDVRTIRLDDKETMSLYTSSKALGYEDDPILGPTGATAIPEFGTGFVKGMLQETQPKTFETLLRISGFSHGTDVWLGNARDYLLSGTATVRELIGCRDDIMLTLIGMGMPEKVSFKIMESVRKGRGLNDDWIQQMKDAGVKQWYIDSCLKCKYLFPKAHASAYVMMAFRIAYFKVHYPIHFYAAYFSVRAKMMDAAIMCMGMETVKKKIKELTEKQKRTAAENDMMVTLEVCYEFYLRGFEFQKIDVYRSDAWRFEIIDDKTLLPPFNSVSGLGDSAAEDIVEKREGMTFVSIDDFASICNKVTKAHIEGLKNVGAFDELPDTAQISLF
ncbi:MAG: PolC-type DNA polymerase III [Oscillospiraceae bacterium]|nr:PolC-type DNA polymerase III [Oscillospiraceae bacterium]